MLYILFLLLICLINSALVSSRGEDLFPVLDKYCKKNLAKKSKEAIMKCETDFDPKLFQPVRDCVKLVNNFDTLPKPAICYISHHTNPKSYKQIEKCINDYFKLNPFDLEESHNQMEIFVECLKKLPIKKKKTEPNTAKV